MFANKFNRFKTDQTNAHNDLILLIRCMMEPSIFEEIYKIGE